MWGTILGRTKCTGQNLPQDDERKKKGRYQGRYKRNVGDLLTGMKTI